MKFFDCNYFILLIKLVSMRRITQKRFFIENEYLILDGMSNEITFKIKSKTIKLTEMQYAFFAMLLKNKCSKRCIVEYLWKGDYITRMSNYHQLIYQCRNILISHGISRKFIILAPNQGVRLNYKALYDE